MTGLKIAAYTLGTACGLSSAFAGVLLGSVPNLAQVTSSVAPGGQPISNATPITLALAMGGISLAATFGWKISRAWSNMENDMKNIQLRMAEVERRCYNRASGSCPPIPGQNR